MFYIQLESNEFIKNVPFNYLCNKTECGALCGILRCALAATGARGSPRAGPADRLFYPRPGAEDSFPGVLLCLLKWNQNVVT